MSDEHVGRIIRELREQQGLSVEELAHRSHCNPKFIEHLETGKLVPSLAPLTKIARGLGVHLGAFLDDAPEYGPIIVRGGHSDSEFHLSGISPSSVGTLDFTSLATNKKDRHMEPFLITVHPTVPEDITLSSHEGEEFIYVLDGAIEVVYGTETHVIEAGDSIYYESTTPHQVQASGDADARILAVIYTPA
ncbi:MAG TPA: XRE family transcriptional regulator [Candidatus Hydrogenedentes bacterium]|nr:XRE family transcriptional regulator [Candidatus Hydrogenedentota bacterium]HNT88460.1 XRE family transcriptional regulator [Candidatus Hydrogenedentota bacterium]